MNFTSTFLKYLYLKVALNNNVGVIILRNIHSSIFSFSSVEKKILDVGP